MKVINRIPILLKAVLAGLIYMGFHLLIIPALYMLALSLDVALVLGMICGILAVLIMYCDSTRRMTKTIILGLGCIVFAQFFLWLTGIPYKIIWYTFRNDSLIQAMGHLEVFELISYNFGFLFFFLPGFLVTLVLSIFIALALVKVREQNVDFSKQIIAAEDSPASSSCLRCDDQQIKKLGNNEACLVGGWEDDSIQSEGNYSPEDEQIQ